METVILGNTEFNIEAVKGKNLEQLQVEFPHVRKEILVQVVLKFGLPPNRKRK
jgi:hypothetical protein